MAAPQLLQVEVLQVLRRRVGAGYTSLDDAEQTRLLMRDLNIRYFDHPMLEERTWELRDNLTAYEAGYVALAEILGVPLLTSDARIAGAPGLVAVCIVVD